VAFSGAIMPGPLLTATISESAHRGFVTGPLIILGHAVLESALIAAIFLGLAPLLRNQLVFGVIAVVGASIMLWMAVGMFRSIPTLSIDASGEAATRMSPVLTGIVMSLSNPYWIIWWATVGLGYVLHAGDHGFLGVAAFFSGHILGDLTWYSFISGAVGTGRRLLTDRRYRWLIGVCAGVLVGFSLFFLYTGIRGVVA
jgi:threonine/homoserine/homoserine lactone efflux protein